MIRPINTGMRCLVLGATGFIGSRLVEKLLGLGHQVVAYGRSDGIARLTQEFPMVEAVAGDFVVESRWHRILADVDVCYHLVSTTIPKTSNDDPIADVQGNVIGTLQLLDAIKRYNTKVVFSSSGGTVYGNISSALVSEDHSTDPLCSYGVAKLAIEKYLSLYRELHGLRATTLRIANPYGLGQRPNASQGAVAVFAGKILQGHTLDIWGDGSVVRDYIYIEDVVSALVASATYGGRYDVFNIGSGVGVSLLELVKTIETVTGKLADIRHHPSRGFDVPRNVLDPSRAKSELNWAPKISLDDGVAATTNWISSYLSISN